MIGDSIEAWFEFSDGGAPPTVIIFHPTVQNHSIFEKGRL